MKKKGGLLFLMSIVLGGFLGMFVGMFKADAESNGIMLDVKPLIPWLSAISLLLAVIILFLTFNFLKKSRKFHVFSKPICAECWAKFFCSGAGEVEYAVENLAVKNLLDLRRRTRVGSNLR